METALSVVSEKGFLASLDEIAKRSKISKGGLYSYFPSKKDLFLSLISEYGNSLIGRVKRKSEKAKTSKEKLEVVFDEIVDLFLKYASLAKFILLESTPTNPEFEAERLRILNELKHLIACILKEAKEKGEAEFELDEDTLALILSGAVYHFILAKIQSSEIEEINLKREDVKSFLLKKIFKEGN